MLARPCKNLKCCDKVKSHAASRPPSRHRGRQTGGHLFFLRGTGGLLGGPGGTSALRRAGPPRHLGIRPPAEGRPLRVGGEVGDRRRPMLPVLTVAGLRLLARRDFTGDAYPGSEGAGVTPPPPEDDDLRGCDEARRCSRPPTSSTPAAVRERGCRR